MASLLLLSCLGILTVLYAVPHGTGGVWDSVAYIGTARNLASGSGFFVPAFLPPWPFTHWPPLYPMMLAAPANFGIDPTMSAKWIDGFFLSCSIFLTGFIAWAYCGRSYALGFLSALAIASSPQMIEIHSQVLSEAPFISMVLASVALLMSYTGSGKTKHLIGLAIALSAASLTRYAGIFFLSAACIIIVLNWQSVKRNGIPFGRVGLALSIVLLPLGFWIVHNILNAGNVVGTRKFVFHLLGSQHIKDLFGNFSLWFAPRAVAPSLRGLLLFVFLAAIAAAAFATLPRPLRRGKTAPPRAALLAEVCLVFDFVYLVFLSLTICFLDASTPFDTRLLLPMFPITVLLLASCLAAAGQKYGRQSFMYRTVIAVGSLIVIFNSVRSVAQARNIRENGVGFQTAQWQDDEVIGFVRDLPNSTVLYADNPLLVYFATGRASRLLPEKYSISSTLASTEYSSQVGQLLEFERHGKVDIVLFHAAWSMSRA